MGGLGWWDATRKKRPSYGDDVGDVLRRFGGPFLDLAANDPFLALRFLGQDFLSHAARQLALPDRHFGRASGEGL